jgi:hypothetical protein
MIIIIIFMIIFIFMVIIIINRVFLGEIKSIFMKIVISTIDLCARATSFMN